MPADTEPSTTPWSEFLTWEGWTAVSAIAQLLALAALIVGIWRFVEKQRQVPLFDLTWDFIGTATFGPHAFHTVEFRNVGRGSGEIFTLALAGARPQLDDHHRAPRALGSGEHFRLQVTSRDIGTAWIRLVYRTHADKRRVYVLWRPLAPAGAMATRFAQDVEAHDSRSYWDMIRDRYRPRPVIPGSVPEASVRYKERSDALLKLMVGPGPDTGETFYPVHASASDLESLPYVPER